MEEGQQLCLHRCIKIALLPEQKVSKHAGRLLSIDIELNLVSRLLLMSIALSYLQSKKQNSYFVQVSTFVTNVAFFFAEK